VLVELFFFYAPFFLNAAGIRKRDGSVREQNRPLCDAILTQNVMGPNPMQLVVVRAVRKAVSAATIIFATSSITLFLSMCFQGIRLLTCCSLSTVLTTLGVTSFRAALRATLRATALGAILAAALIITVSAAALLRILHGTRV